MIWAPAAPVESLATSTRSALAVEQGKRKRVNPPRMRASAHMHGHTSTGGACVDGVC